MLCDDCRRCAIIAQSPQAPHIRIAMKRAILSIGTVALLAVALLPPASASTYRGNIGKVMQKGAETMIYVHRGAFEGAPSACTWGEGLIVRVDNRTPQGLRLIAAALTSSPVIVRGDGNCQAAWIYKDAQAEGAVSVELAP
jgi:hypothetical protein